MLLREIQGRGYDGGYSRWKLFVRRLVPVSPREAVVRFESEPGRQMQADWAAVGHSGAIWDLSQNQIRPAARTSADATGLLCALTPPT